MRLRLPAFLLACLVLVALAAAPATALGSAKRAMLSDINAARAANGLATVRPAKSLMRSSRRYARFMLRNDVWAHAAHPARGSSFSYIGEILGMTSTPGPAPAAIVRAWLASPEHRPILLSGRYRYVGIGVRRGDMQGTEAWIWVVRFGAR